MPNSVKKAKKKTRYAVVSRLQRSRCASDGDKRLLPSPLVDRRWCTAPSQFYFLFLLTECSPFVFRFVSFFFFGQAMSHLDENVFQGGGTTKKKTNQSVGAVRAHKSNRASATKGNNERDNATNERTGPARRINEFLPFFFAGGRHPFYHQLTS